MLAIRLGGGGGSYGVCMYPQHILMSVHFCQTKL